MVLAQPTPDSKGPKQGNSHSIHTNIDLSLFVTSAAQHVYALRPSSAPGVKPAPPPSSASSFPRPAGSARCSDPLKETMKLLVHCSHSCSRLTLTNFHYVWGTGTLESRIDGGLTLPASEREPQACSLGFLIRPGWNVIIIVYLDRSLYDKAGKVPGAREGEATGLLLCSGALLLREAGQALRRAERAAPSLGPFWARLREFLGVWYLVPLVLNPPSFAFLLRTLATSALLE